MRATNQRIIQAAISIAVGICSASAIPLIQAGQVPTTQQSDASPTTRPITPKPLSDQVKRGLSWLVKHQQADGGWSQGEASLQQYREGEVGDKSNVADTCMAALALMRAGSTPTQGEYATNISSAVNFICAQVEKSPQEGLFITDIKGTRVQTKLGQYIDTFAAALFLAELKPLTPDPAMHKRVMAALDKTMDKIEKNQKQDGHWVEAHDGWASALCQSVAIKAVNTAAQNNVSVSAGVLQRAQEYSAKQFDGKSGTVDSSGSANVELYARAGNLANFQNSANTNAGLSQKLDKRSEEAQQQVAEAQKTLHAATTQPAAYKPEQIAAAQSVVTHNQKELKDVNDQLLAIQGNATNLKQAQQKLVERLGDRQFEAGFGSNGGEEFLSYMNIGESLVLKGGDEFAKWDKGMTENLDRVQNEDGSWAGQHCITGRTFCTAAALMTLTVDRSVHAPVADRIKSEK